MLFLRDGSRKHREGHRARVVPRVLRGSVSYQGPVCAECQEAHLYTDTDGEYVLKPDHPLPAAAEPLGAATLRKHKAVLVVQPKFALGQLVATPEALRALEESGQPPSFFLDRHVQGDWGGAPDVSGLVL